MNALRRAVEDKYIITSDFNISELKKMQPSQADKRIIAGARTTCTTVMCSTLS
jgi:hypothetical protein